MAKLLFKHSESAYGKFRVFIQDTTSATGAGLTGLTFASSGLEVHIITDNEATFTDYTAAGSTIETITTLGTFAAPTATKCRFKEVGYGIYEIQVADARWAVAGSRACQAIVKVTGGFCAPVEIQLALFDVNDTVRGGMTALPNAAAGAIGGLLTSPDVANIGKADMRYLLGTVLTEGAAGRLAAGLINFLNVASPVLTVASVNQTGDAFARLGAPTGASVSVDIASARTEIAAVLSAINALNNLSALANLQGNQVMEIPDSGSNLYKLVFRVQDQEGLHVDLDGTPTISVSNPAGTDRSANLSAVSHPSTGIYTFTYSVASGHAEEGLWFTASGALGGSARRADFVGAVVNFDYLTVVNTINSNVATIVADYMRRTGDNVTLAATQSLYAPAKAGDAMALTSGERVSVGTAVWADASATSLLARIGAFTGSGVNTVLGFFKALLSKTATLPTDVGGTFDPTTDSTEAIRDRGDAAWTGGGGGGGGNDLDELLADHTIAGSAGQAISDILAATATLGAATVEVQSPVAVDGDISLYYGASYTVASGAPVSWSSDSWQDLTGATVDVVRLDAASTSYGWAVDVLTPGAGTQTVRAQITAAQVKALGLGNSDIKHPFRVVARLANGQDEVLVDGTIFIL